ncbi:MAG: PepSY-like domain-containing protein [Saprospiraceae bacterium]
MLKNLKFFLPLFVLLMGLMSCEKETNTSDEALITDIATAADLQAITPDNLPEASQKYIEDNYFDTYIETAESAPSKGYRVTLGLGEILYFNTTGDVLEYGETLRPNGPFGGVHPHGPCFRLRRFLRGHGGHHDCNGDGEPDGPFAFSVDSLPSAITDYVAANYPDNEIVRAAFRDDRYLTLVNVPVVLAFDADGNVLAEINPLEHCSRPCNSLTQEELPEAVAAYITANHPAATFRRACTGERGTLVMLTQDGQRIVLGFDADGNLVFQRP